MSLYKGRKITAEIYGESHADKIGIRVTGFPEFAFSPEKLKEFTERRKPSLSVFSTKRREPDEPRFYRADGSEITDNFLPSEWVCEIKNADRKSGDYNELYGKPRPSHADYAWHLKDGALDFSGGGRFSGRLTAVLCVAGAVAKEYLESRGVRIAAFVSRVGGIDGGSYKTQNLTPEIIEKLRAGEFPSLKNKAEMLAAIKNAAAEKDSLGGKIECVITGAKAIGDNLFGGLEGKIAEPVYAIPAVKGVEFGAGFDFADMTGSRANDELYIDEAGKTAFKSNDSGGINGGIANGAPITFGVAMRPTPSIAKEQNTVDLIKNENTVIAIKGRHDACVVPRAVPCVESAAALALLDEIL